MPIHRKLDTRSIGLFSYREQKFYLDTHSGVFRSNAHKPDNLIPCVGDN